MNDEKLKELMSAYDVPDVRPEQIKTAAQKARSSLGRTVFTRNFSFWQQISVQASFLSVWFYISCAAIAFVCLFFSISAESGSSVFFGISPLYVLPCSASVYRAVSSGMTELEASCRYSMTKMFVAKMIVLGAVVSVLIFTVSLPSSFSENGYSPRPLLFGFISFTLTSAVILWFGKRNIKRGIVCGVIWSTAIYCISATSVYRKFIDSTSIEIVFVIFLFGLAAVTLTSYKYIKEISYEGANEAWNCSLTA